MKKILFLSNSKGYSGGEVVLERLLLGLKNYQCSVYLPEGTFSEKLVKNHVRVFINNALTKLRTAEDKLYIFKSLWKFFYVSLRLIFLIKKNKPDLVIANGMSVVPYAIMSNIFFKKKILWIHHHPILESKSKEYYLAPRFANLVDKIIPVSLALSKSLIRSGVDHRKLKTIYNGLDLNVFKENKWDRNYLRKTYGLSEDSVLIGLIGTITEWKGFHVVLAAVKCLQKKGFLDNNKIIVFFIGKIFEKSKKDLEYNNFLTDYIKKNQLTHYVYFTGNLDHMPKVYQDLDIVLNCSVKPEPLGTTIYEAMSMGKIVIASEIGGTPEIIEDRIDGFLSKPGDAEELSNLLVEITPNLFKYSQIKANARKKVEGKFSIDKMVDEYNTLIEPLFN